MHRTIAEICRKLEQINNIQILVAVENGSRAWGMASKNSDYDVRFIFKRPLNDYLQIFKPPEVITAYFNGEGCPCRAQDMLFDVQGFDIFKYVKLLYVSNPTSIEWAVSPIVYFGKPNHVITTYAHTQFNPRTLYLGYKGQCKGNYLKYIQSEKQITQKRYLYVLRGLLNAKWVKWKETIPPMNILETISRLQEQIPSQIAQILRELIKDRAQGIEIEQIPPISELNVYVETFLRETVEPSERTTSSTKLDKELQQILLFCSSEI